MCVRFDTKKYYIPHTRLRGYMVCFRNPTWDEWHPNRQSLPEKLELVSQWSRLVKQMERPASSTVEDFLLAADDPRIHQGRLDLTTKTRLASDGTQRAATDWGRCQGRHEKARHDEKLGNKRPMTNWTEGGLAKLKDGFWADWGNTQTERVLDLAEINMLRQAKQGVDAEYKAFVWNLSQNVDRTTGSNAAAISPCLTPNMIAYLTNRGGPVIGREALSLQGLPIEKLLLTRESEDDLADLAGNAMTSTVVGTCMIAALIVAKPLLDLARRQRGRIDSVKDELDAPVRGANKISVVGADVLDRQALDLSDVTHIEIATLLEHAARSARHCRCEGQSDLVDEKIGILRCQACSHLACTSCAGRPTHEYRPSTTSSDRIEPRVFGDQLRAMIPTRLTFAGVDDALIDSVRARAETERGVTVADSDWSLYKTKVVAAFDPEGEYRFKWIRRRDTWTLRMALGEQAYLQLNLDSVSPTWHLFVQADRKDGIKSRRRKLLQPPVARLKLDRTASSVLSGEWEIALPSINTFDITIEGRGELRPSWESALGLSEFEADRVHSEIDVLVPAESRHFLDVDVSGRYYLHSSCGTAMDSLFIRPATADAPSVSFFLDPTRSSHFTKDAFVFAARSDRLEHNEHRTVYATVNPKWRPIQTTKSAETTCTVDGTWVATPEANLAALSTVVDPEAEGATVPMATVSLPRPGCDLALTPDSCQTATAIVAVSVPIAHPEGESKLWGKDEWHQVDIQLKGRDFQEQMAWMTERLPEISAFKDWSEIECDAVVEQTEPTCCSRCAPVAPGVGWILSAGKLLPLEDPAEAGEFERALKNRPAPFVIQTRLDGHLGTMEVALNVTSLLHQALSLLPPRKDSPHTLAWRLLPNHPSVESSIFISKPFVIPSNKDDPTCDQPPSFAENGMALRPEQLRSFAWAMRQERPEVKYTFEEEEIVEARLAPMGWRAEGRASRKVLVRGGVIADAVGYGKTAISLAVIDASRKLPSLATLNPTPKGMLHSKATLIVVPGHLMDQWENEGELARRAAVQGCRSSPR